MSILDGANTCCMAKAWSGSARIDPVQQLQVYRPVTRLGTPTVLSFIQNAEAGPRIWTIAVMTRDRAGQQGQHRVRADMQPESRGRLRGNGPRQGSARQCSV